MNRCSCTFTPQKRVCASIGVHASIGTYTVDILTIGTVNSLAHILSCILSPLFFSINLPYLVDIMFYWWNAHSVMLQFSNKEQTNGVIMINKCLRQRNQKPVQWKRVYLSTIGDDGGHMFLFPSHALIILAYGSTN